MDPEAEAAAAAAQDPNAPAVETAGLTYGSQAMQFELRGNYQSAFSFIQQAGTLGKILSVDELGVKQSPQSEGAWDGMTEATIDLKVRALILPPKEGFPAEITVKVYN